MKEVANNNDPNSDPILEKMTRARMSLETEEIGFMD